MKVIDTFRLDERVAIVTGAGRGLGKEMAIALGEAGASVYVADLNRTTAEEVACELRSEEIRAHGVGIDVTDRESIERLRKEILDRYGRIDILVNNAGVVYRPLETGGSVSIPMEEVPFETWANVINVNVIGVFNCTQIFGREMLSHGSGNIINIASISAFVGNIGRGNNAYCTSKGAVATFTKQLATEWAARGVRVNAIAPGYMRSALGAPLDDPELKDLLPRMTPMVRPGVPQDLKGIVVFLASDASSYVTGQSYVVDGGYTSW